MSGERYSIQDLGGTELARHYPDRGLIADSNWYNAVLRAEPEAGGVVSWLRSLKHCKGFWAVLSANAEGLRVLVASDQFVVFNPWGEATVSAARVAGDGRAPPDRGAAVVGVGVPPGRRCGGGPLPQRGSRAATPGPGAPPRGVAGRPVAGRGRPGGGRGRGLARGVAHAGEVTAAAAPPWAAPFGTPVSRRNGGTGEVGFPLPRARGGIAARGGSRS